MPTCEHCQNDRPSDAAACPHCGTPAPTTAEPITEARATEVYIGSNAGYYTDKWADMRARGKQMSWNWPAFLITLIWFPYRKMYLYTAIMVGAIFVETIAEELIDLPDNVSRIVSIAIGITIAMMGNTLYRMHVEKHVRRILALNLPEEETIAALTRQGGTSIIGAIAVPVLFVLAICGLGALADWYAGNF